VEKVSAALVSLPELPDTFALDVTHWP